MSKQDKLVVSAIRVLSAEAVQKAKSGHPGMPMGAADMAYALWGMLLKHNPVSKVTIFSFTTPIFGTILSLLLLPENSGVDPLNLIITLLLVSGGILLLNYQNSKNNKSLQ